MASEMPPTDAEQPKSLLAQYHERLMWRLAAWGGAAAFSLAVAVIVSQTASGHKRLQVAFSGSEQPYDIPPSVPVATAPMPPADLIAVKRATLALKRTSDQTAAKLAVVERNTAEARAETKRLALQVGKLRTDSFRVTGRLANIEHQIDGITGSIKGITRSVKKQAEEAAAAAVAKAMPPKPAFDRVFDMNAPVISPPATMSPKLSLIVPPAPDSKSASVTADATKPADRTKLDISTTSSITRPETKSKDQSRVASKFEGMAAPDVKPMAKASAKPEELKAGVAIKMKAAPKAKQQIAMTEPKPEAKSMAKAGGKAERPSAAMKDEKKIASVVVRPRRRHAARHWVPTRGYGIDLGGAESVTVAKAQWAAIKANFGPMLGGMRPLVVRNHRLLSAGDYRLVAGRTRSLKTAQRICKRLALQQVTCQPIEFADGRMVWR